MSFQLHRCAKLSVAFAAAPLIALSGCSTATAPPNPAESAGIAPSAPAAPTPTGPRYQDQRAHFALTLPAGFLQVGSSDDPSVAAQFTLPGEGPNTVRATLSVVVTPNTSGLPALVAKSRGLLQVALKEYQPMLDEPITLPNGVQAWLLGGTYILQSVPARNMQLYVVDHNTSYVITGLTTKQIFGEFEPVFRGVFNTLTLQ